MKGGRFLFGLPRRMVQMRPEKECGPCFDRRRPLIDGLNHGSAGGLLSRITEL